MELFWYALAASLFMSVVALSMAPKQKSPATKAQTLETPTVDAGRRIPVVFGRVVIKSPNLLYMGGKYTQEVRRSA